MSAIRHCVEESNVDKNYFVVDPNDIRHVEIRYGKIHNISAKIDPLSHLNLDFSQHLIEDCVITKKFVKGENIKFTRTGFMFAKVNSVYFKKYGKFDYTKRYKELIEKAGELK